MRVIYRWVIGCCLAIASVGCAGTQFGAQTAEGGWWRIETEHFLIHSAQGRIAALEMARTLEEIRASLLKLGWGNASEPKGRTEFVIFDRKSEFSKYYGNAQADGVAVSQLGKERLLSFYPDGSNGVPFVAVHELTHDLSRWFLPLQPLWYSEGVATYFETLEFDRDTHTATVGGLNELRINVLKTFGFTIRAEKLFNASTSIRENPQESASVYAGVWLLTHFLRNEHTEDFNKFRSDLASLMPWKEAWKKHFGVVDMDKFNGEIVQYASRAKFTTFSAEIELPAFEPKVRSLSKVEARGLMLWTAQRFSNGELYEKLLASAPPGTQGDINALKAKVTRSSDKKERRELTATMVKRFADDGEAWLMRAEVLGGDSGGPEALSRAAELVPDHPGVRRMMVASALMAKEAEVALGHAQVLIRRSPAMPSIYAGFIRAMAANGGCEFADTVIESIGLVLGECTWIDDDTKEKSTCSEYLQTVKKQACSAN